MKKAPGKAKPRAPARPKVPVVDGADTLPPTKRKAAAVADTDLDYEMGPVAPKKQRNVRQVEPRSPRPERKTRNPNPAGPAIAAAQAIKDADAAEKAMVKEAARRKVAELDKMKQMMLAQLELAEEEEEEEEEEAAVNNIADLETMETEKFAALGGMMDDELEWAIDTFVAMSDEEDEPDSYEHKKAAKAIAAGLEAVKEQVEIEPLSPPASKNPKSKKRARGDTRDAVDALKDDVRQAKKGSGPEGSGATAFAKLQSLFPTGMDPNWRTKVNASGVHLKAAKATSGVRAGSKSSTSKKVDDGDVLGGLTDSDNVGNRPSGTASTKGTSKFLTTGVKGLNQKRVNDDVVFVESDDDDTTRRSHPVPSASKKTKAVVKTRVKPELTRKPLAAESSLVTLAASSPSPDIPIAIAATWDRDWIPTILHLLGSSLDPWEISVEQLQSVFSKVYPDVSYNLVAQGNIVMKRTRDRINNGRSSFGTLAQQVVTKFFNAESFSKLPKEKAKAKIKAYTKFALRPNGPMLWSNPESEFIRKGRPGYEEPSGFCESEFVISTLGPFVKKISNSQHDGNLVGALSMAAAAVEWMFLLRPWVLTCCCQLEKTFLMYETGEYINDGSQFSRENVSAIVADYGENVSGFSARKWERILRLCGATNASAQAPGVSAPSMQTSRRALYISSSPIKGAESD
ncbi:hypothetical protein B0H11DRAFT_2279655 [Mycena galericulata]|nr:hypothetical protein B0H11DRAFT_2279655 [Mycena galericulata]